MRWTIHTRERNFVQTTTKNYLEKFNRKVVSVAEVKGEKRVQ